MTDQHADAAREPEAIAREILKRPPPPRGRPTIEELKKLLQAPDGPAIYINPDGSITASEPPEHLVQAVAAALRAARNEALTEAAVLVATLAERPYDNEPEFSALMDAESRIRALKVPT